MLLLDVLRSGNLKDPCFYLKLLLRMYNARLKQWMQALSHLLYQMRKNILPTRRKNGNIFSVFLGGGVPSPFIFREEADNEPSPQEEAEENVPSPQEEAEENADEKPEVSDQDAEISGNQTVPVDSGPGDPEEESDDEVIQQPIPFQMGVTPMAEEGEAIDELQTWYEGTQELKSQARGSTDPVPNKSSKPRPKPSIRERSPRSLRNRQVARSIASQPKAKVHCTIKVCHQNK